VRVHVRKPIAFRAFRPRNLRSLVSPRWAGHCHTPAATAEVGAGEGDGSPVPAPQELEERSHTFHVSRGITTAASSSDLDSHAAQRRAEERLPQASPVPAAHQGLAGGARVGEERGSGRQAPSLSRAAGWVSLCRGGAWADERGWPARRRAELVEEAADLSAQTGQALRSEDSPLGEGGAFCRACLCSLRCVFSVFWAFLKRDDCFFYDMTRETLLYLLWNHFCAVFCISCSQ